MCWRVSNPLRAAPAHALRGRVRRDQFGVRGLERFSSFISLEFGVGNRRIVRDVIAMLVPADLLAQPRDLLSRFRAICSAVAKIPAPSAACSRRFLTPFLTGGLRMCSMDFCYRALSQRFIATPHKHTGPQNSSSVPQRRANDEVLYNARHCEPFTGRALSPRSTYSRFQEPRRTPTHKSMPRTPTAGPAPAKAASPLTRRPVGPIQDALVIFNPASGRGKSARLKQIDRARAILSRDHIETQLFLPTAPAKLREAPPISREKRLKTAAS